MNAKDSLINDALAERQDLEKVVELFESFKKYVETLLKFIKSDVSDQEFTRNHEAFKLSIEDEEFRFLEWRNGDKVWNKSIASLVFNWESYQDLDEIAQDILLATVKFEHLLKVGKQQLLEVHEKLEIFTSAAEAEKITQLNADDKERSFSDQVEIADHHFEKVFKWGKRVFNLGVWLWKLYNIAPT